MTDWKCLGPPRCRYTSTEGVKWHEEGCPMRGPRPAVQPDPYRSRNPVAEVTGGEVHGRHDVPWTQRDEPARPIHGVDDEGYLIHSECDECRAIGWHGLVLTVTGPDTPIAAGVMASSREEAQEALGRLGIAPMSVVALKSLDQIVAQDLADRVRSRRPEDAPADPDAAWSAYGALLDACMDLRRWLLTRDKR